MQVYKSLYDGELTIKLVGELDEYTAKYTRIELDKIIDNVRFKYVVFDLSDLNFMDSTGIGVFLGRYKRIKNKNLSVYIANPNNQIEKIFKMSGIFEIMPKIS